MAATRGFLVVMSVLQSVIVARALGPEGRGTLAAVIGFAGVLVALGGLGFSSANPYFLLNRPESHRAIVSNSLWIGGIGGLVLAAGGLLLYEIDSGVLPGLSSTEVVVALIAVPAMLCALFLQSVLLGQFRTRLYNALAAIVAALPPLALAVAYLVLGLDVLSTLIVTTAAQYVGLLAYAAVTMRRRPSRFDASLAREMLRYGVRVYAATTLAFLVIRVDVLLVNGYLGATASGLYTTAVAIADLLYLLPIAVGFSLFPRIADTKDTELTLRVIRAFGPIMLGLSLASVALAAPAITLLYGPDFSDAAHLYYWLAPGAFALGMSTVLSQHFAGVGFPWSLVLVWLAGLSVNVALNLALLDRGAYIAALSSSVAYMLVFALHLAFFARELGGWLPLLKPHSSP
ncbi:MAG: oligosaccharide flippase family protein [Chloroflexota bacterium]|nr:oligosaccharide flippase family protein [Chloroflexota bacterium]